MSRDIVLSNIKKFKEDFDKANEPENSRVPSKDMFMQIREDLNIISDMISIDPDSLGEKADSMRETVCNLNELLIKGLAVVKKQRGSTGICAEFLFITRTRKKLQKIKNDLKHIQAWLKAEKVSSSKIGNRINPPIDEKTVEWKSYVFDDSKVFGLDAHAKHIINKSLIKENIKGLNVVGIIGVFGSGKTTLAQKIFLSKEVREHFTLRLWICVSAKCKEEELIERMLDELGVEQNHIEEMLKIKHNLEKVGVLLFLLHLELLNIRYLIVFEDVVNIETWHCDLEKEPPEKEEEQWDGRLAYGLPKGDGSAIIITSRKEYEIQKMVGKEHIYCPQPLGVKDGWALFKSSFEEVKMPRCETVKISATDHQEMQWTSHSLEGRWAKDCFTNDIEGR